MDERGSEASRADKADLARVSIVRYEDKTGTQNFGYMPSSLTEAIDSSLQSRFEYRREDPMKTEASITAFRKKNPGLNAETAADFCRTNKTDILIFGHFEFDAIQNQIVVRTSISLGSESKFRVLEERRNPVNATIFRLADLVADDIVRALSDIAKEQAAGKQVSRHKSEKLELKKNNPLAWTETVWNISPGFTALIPLNASFSGHRMPQGMLSLTAERRIFKGIYMGVLGAVANVRASAIAMDLYQGAALLGYHWQISARWDLFLQGGAGYYFGKYYNNSTCSANCTAASAGEAFKIQNPYFTARTGVNVLLFSWLSIGIFGQGDVFYDKPTPLFFGGGGVTVGAHF